MLRLSTFTAILVLPLALVACDAANGGGSEGSSSSTAASAGSGDAEQAQPTAMAGSQPPECVSGLLQTARFAGAWNVRAGEGWFGGHSTRAGENNITLRASGNDLTMTVPEFPTVRMQRVPRVANYSAERDTFRWQHNRADAETDPDVAVSSDEAVLVFGCENMNEMARFQGQARIESDGMSSMATFRLVMTGPDDAILHWEMASPVASSGLFNISRAP